MNEVQIAAVLGLLAGAIIAGVFGYRIGRREMPNHVAAQLTTYHQQAQYAGQLGALQEKRAQLAEQELAIYKRAFAARGLSL